MEDDDEAHMRFQAPGSQPITKLDPDIVAMAFEGMPDDGNAHALNALSSFIAKKQQMSDEVAGPPFGNSKSNNALVPVVHSVAG